MLIRGFPATTDLPNASIRGARFWYWRGASGRNYIHTIHKIGACPPLPGAVYVAVRLIGGGRHPVSVGRFACFWDGSMGGPADAALESIDADEVHVHVLARNNAAAEAAFHDLACALPETSEGAGGKADVFMLRAA